MATLLDAEFEMFPFFELTPDLVCIVDKDGFFKNINRAVIDKLEYTEEELFSVPVSTFIHPSDRSLTAGNRKNLLDGKALINFQNRYITKSGNIVWLQWTSIYFSEKEVVFAIAKDVTEGKQAELEIEQKYKKFKSLATHFKSSIERDRKYLAVELHEELAQLASVVKMDVNWIIDNVPDLPVAANSRMEHASVVAELLIKSIRRISFAISPDMLNDIGLNETLEWLCNEFSLLNGIPCRFKSSYDETGLSKEIELDFFRICQESLNNVMYHAQATTVKISIEDKGDCVELCIMDDGKGFIVDEHKKTSGLTAIRERTASINGRLTIKSEKGKGTKVHVTVAKTV